LEQSTSTLGSTTYIFSLMPTSPIKIHAGIMRIAKKQSILEYKACYNINQEDLKMDNKSAETERKELNKKLIKKSFLSEMKSQKHIVRRFIINLIAIFLGLCLSDWVTQSFAINSAPIEMLITVILIVVMEFIAERLVEALSGK